MDGHAPWPGPAPFLTLGCPSLGRVQPTDADRPACSLRMRTDGNAPWGGNFSTRFPGKRLLLFGRPAGNARRAIASHRARLVSSARLMRGRAIGCHWRSPCRIPSKAVRVMSTRPACRSRPSSQITTSAKVRWMSIPITRLTISSLPIEEKGAWGSRQLRIPRSQRNRASRRGGQLQTRARSSSYKIGLPALRAPGALIPEGRTIRWNHQDFSRTERHRRSSYRLQTQSSY